MIQETTKNNKEEPLTKSESIVLSDTILNRLLNIVKEKKELEKQYSIVQGLLINNNKREQELVDTIIELNNFKSEEVLDVSLLLKEKKITFKLK